MECLPVGTKNLTRKADQRRADDRLAVRNENASEDDRFPALTEKQRNDATLQAILVYDKNFLQFRKQNEGKGVIVVSIAVTAEGMHPTGRNVGRSIVKEMEQVSLYNDGMANLVRLVTCKGVTYYENPTVEEQRELGAPGELLFNAKGNKQLAMHVEKVMQVNITPRDDCPREHQAFTADSREWLSATRVTIQSWGSLLTLQNNRKLRIRLQR